MIRNCVLLLAIGIESAPADWPQFLGARRDGSTDEINLSVPWPKQGPQILWRIGAGQGWSGPVIASNRVVLFHRLENRETVECLNGTNGTLIWRSDYPASYRDDFGFEEGPRSTPAISRGRVFTFGADGILACWSFETGTNLWRVDTREQFGTGKGFFGVACSPLIEGDAVILNIGGRDQAGVVAFDADSGKVLWKATQQEASYSSPVTASIDGKQRAFVLGRSALVALDPASGKVFWEFPFRPEIQASVTAATPLVIGSQVFVSASYGAGATLLHVNDSVPEVIWRGDDALSNHYATSVHHRGFLYGFDGRQEERCHFRCVELKTGKIRWSADHFGAGTLIRVGQHLVILTEGGEVMMAMASPEKFSVIARAQVLGRDCRAYPAFSNGRFYARDKRNLICVEFRAVGN